MTSSQHYSEVPTSASPLRVDDVWPWENTWLGPATIAALSLSRNGGVLPISISSRNHLPLDEAQ